MNDLVLPELSGLQIDYRPVREHVALVAEPGAERTIGQLASEPAARAVGLDLASGAWVALRQDGVQGWCHLRDVLPTGTAHLPWFALAHSQIGTRQTEDEALVRAYVQTTKKRPPGAAIPDWCGCFVSWCMKRCEPPRPANPDSARALDWEDWGRMRLPLETARVGDLVVGQRRPFNVAKDKRRGHVAFLIARSGNALLLLGGNQSADPLREGLPKSVRYSWYPVEHPEGRLLTARYYDG